MRFFIVDAFTDKAFSGNTAGVVVLDDDFLDEKFMINFANELRYSETAFVKKISDDEFHIRYFTPNSEIDICGHATIATFKVLNHLKICKNNCKVKTIAGEVFVEITNENEIFMSMAKPEIIKTLSYEESLRFYSVLGITDNFNKDFPPQIVSTGLLDVILMVNDESELLKISPDFKALANLSKEFNVVGVHAFCKYNDFCKVRNFAPLYDIDEEAATGTANAALMHYLREKSIHIHTFYQGEGMGRASIIKTKISKNEILVGGEAVIVACGELIT